MGGLDGPPKPPALGGAAAKSWRPSKPRRGFGASTGTIAIVATLAVVPYAGLIASAGRLHPASSTEASAMGSADP